MSNEEKLNITVLGDDKNTNPTITIQKAISHIMLNDLSSATFNTDNPESFVKFVQSELFARNHAGSTPIHLFGSVSSSLVYTCELWEKLASYTQHALAAIELKPSHYAIQFVNCIINQKLTLQQLGLYSKMFLKNDPGNADLMTLVNFSRNCKFTMITDFEQSYDNKGNFALKLSNNLKDNKYEVDIPESVVFTFPIFETTSLRERTISIPVTTVITHDGNDTEKKLHVTFECIGAKEDLMIAIETFMRESYFRDFNDILFSGKRTINKHRNEDFIAYDPVKQ
jgi:hypothetical protein